MKASIISIGDEILIGQIVNTNSQWIAKKLNEIGIKVEFIVSIKDDIKEIKNTLKTCEKKTDFIFVTGGLGPTKDDITKESIIEYFNTKLIQSNSQLKIIKSIFKKNNAELLDINIKQSYVPKNSQVYVNKKGTAPGFMIEKNKKNFFFTPGVPYEMEYIFTKSILPFLLQKFDHNKITHRNFLIYGIGESFLSEKISAWEKSLKGKIKLAYLPSYGTIRLRLSSYKNNIDNFIEKKINELKKIIPDNFVGEIQNSFEEELIKILVKKKITLSIAESCTGGYISHYITKNSGVSSFFKGSIVAYKNSIKKKLLNVSEKTLKQYGAVSKNTVIEMAKGVKELLKTDYSISISGIAGPSGGTKNKPTGTIWICVMNNNKYITKKLSLKFDREKNIKYSSLSTLVMLYLLIKK